MTLKLVKTISGNNCKCGSANFIKIGIAWNCGDCGLYIPAQLKQKTPEQLRQSFNDLTNLHKELKAMTDDLEKLIEE